MSIYIRTKSPYEMLNISLTEIQCLLHILLLENKRCLSDIGGCLECLLQKNILAAVERVICLLCRYILMI